MYLSVLRWRSYNQRRQMAATFTDLFLGYQMMRSLGGVLSCDIIQVAPTRHTVHRGLLANRPTVNELCLDHNRIRGGKVLDLNRTKTTSSSKSDA